MTRIRHLAGVRSALLLGLAIGFALTTWKMLQFHGRLAALENPQWEQRLPEQHIYKHPIVLFGDSQIYNWPVATSFGVLPIIDRGVVGDFATSSYPRFEREVLPLNPVLVVILIGTNDVAHGQSTAAILASIEHMTAAARKQHAAVILCSVLPARGAAARVRPRQLIEQVNAGLQLLAQQQGASYLDLYSTLQNAEGELDPTFTEDGLHLNGAGYVRLSKVLLPHLLPYYLTNAAGVQLPANPAQER